MADPLIQRAYDARTLEEIEAVEPAIADSLDASAPGAAEQLEMMRLAIEDKERQNIVDAILRGDLP